MAGKHCNCCLLPLNGGLCDGRSYCIGCRDNLGTGAERARAKPDVINAPPHYIEGRKYEPIDVIEDWKLPFHLGNALKYISRAGRKNNEIEDLKKAVWYLNRYIERNK